MTPTHTRTKNSKVPRQANNVRVTCHNCGETLRLRDGHVCCKACGDGDTLLPNWRCPVCGRKGE